MLARLTVPYADASAGDLCWALAGSGLVPLAGVEVRLGSAAVRLSVLGASHEVVATMGGETCTEVIACGVGAGGPLPSSATRVLAGLRYRMTSTVLRLDAGDLARRAGELRARLAGDDRALVAAFPGHDVAITALEARGDGRRLGWRTWHAYPRTGELVVTATRLWAP